MEILKQNRITNLQKILTLLSANCPLNEAEAQKACEQILFLKNPEYLFKNQQQINKALKELSEYKEIMNLEIKFQMEENDICPITRMPFIQPVTGKCGHKFEKSSLEDLTIQRLKCPVVGCGKEI